MELALLIALGGLALAASKEAREWLKFKFETRNKQPPKPPGPM
jgi:hypothetical protein